MPEKPNPKFKKGQLLQVGSGGPFGEVVKIELRSDGYWYTLDGDMYPYVYPEKELRGLTKRQIG